MCVCVCVDVMSTHGMAARDDMCVPRRLGLEHDVDREETPVTISTA